MGKGCAGGRGKMNLIEKKLLDIKRRESEIHTNRKTKSGKPLPDITGYEDEDLMLSDFMTWMHNKYPEISPFVFHIENEGSRGGISGAIDGAISKGKGKKKGVLDVESIWRGLMTWMEAKLPGGTFSDEQLAFIGHLTENGHDVYIFRNFKMFKFIIDEIVIARRKLGGGIWTSVEQIQAKLASS